MACFWSINYEKGSDTTLGYPVLMELPQQQHKTIHQWVVDQVKCDQDLNEINYTVQCE